MYGNTDTVGSLKKNKPEIIFILMFPEISKKSPIYWEAWKGWTYENRSLTTWYTFKTAWMVHKAWLNTIIKLMLESIGSSEREKKKNRNNMQLTVKRGFFLKMQPTLQTVCCNSSSSNHKYNEKKDRSDVGPRSHQSDWQAWNGTIPQSPPLPGCAL